MKKTVIRQFSLVLGLVAFMMIGLGWAEPTGQVRWSIPFEFVVDNASLPAGDYIVQRIQAHSADSLMVLKSVDGKDFTYFVAQNAVLENSTGKPRLIFNQYKNRYFLTRIQESGNIPALLIPKSKQEKSVADEMRSSANGQPKVVAVLSH
jgi:hypothetical protein